MGEVEEKLEAYEVKREGEAEILMLKSNAVFFNPVQVPPFPRFFLFWRKLVYITIDPNSEACK
jgi:hypothetical protein